MKNFIVSLMVLWGGLAFSGAEAADDGAPTIQSLYATALDNREFTFTAAASGPAETLQYHWDFGDGFKTQGAASETHVFPADGTYTVQLVVSNGSASSAPQTVAVRAGSRAIFLVNTPRVTKKKFSISFLKPSQNSLNFAFQDPFITFPSLLSFTSKFPNALITVYIGNIQIDSMILTKTKGKGLGSVSFNYKKGTVEYKVKGNQQLGPLLAQFGAINATVAGAIGVPLEIDINNGIDIIGIFTTVPFSYSAKFDKKGTGK